jgi:hypothetical protein
MAFQLPSCLPCCLLSRCSLDPQVCSNLALKSELQLCFTNTLLHIALFNCYFFSSLPLSFTLADAGPEVIHAIILCAFSHRLDICPNLQGHSLQHISLLYSWPPKAETPSLVRARLFCALRMLGMGMESFFALIFMCMRAYVCIFRRRRRADCECMCDTASFFCAT